MKDTITLIGTEQFERSYRKTSDAAEKMNRAAASFEDSLFRQRQFMEAWLADFERIMNGAKAVPASVDWSNGLR